MPETTKKRCSQCGQVKSRSDFYKDKTRPSGLKSVCKECWGAVPAKSIENENQIDSVIREMAELQANIDHEKASCQHRISLIQKYTGEITEPYVLHQTFLQSTLLSFLKKQGGKRFFRRYRFGAVSYSRGKLEIELNVELARQRMGKP